MSDPLRFFVPAEWLLGDQVEITGETFHHLRNVLRVSPGKAITLMDGQGNCCEVELTDALSKHATGRVLSRWQEEDHSLPITLLQALPKGDKLDLVLQKGTEMGIHSFQPVLTDHAVPQLSPSRLSKRQQRWQRIVNEAARQSRRSFLPEIGPLLTLENAIAKPSRDLKLVLWESGSVPLAEALPGERPEGVRLLVGPEGGFSSEEISMVTSAGFQAVHLGPRILRTETAGLAATPVLQYLYGDWQLSPVDNNSIHREEKP